MSLDAIHFKRSLLLKVVAGDSSLFTMILIKSTITAIQHQEIQKTELISYMNHIHTKYILKYSYFMLSKFDVFFPTKYCHQVRWCCNIGALLFIYCTFSNVMAVGLNLCSSTLVVAMNVVAALNKRIEELS